MRIKIIHTRQAPSVFRLLFQIQRGHAPTPEIIKRGERPYWQERGWVRRGNRYIGTYQTRYGSFRGVIEQQGSNYFQFFILDPPPELQNHSHWACFQDRGGKGFNVHMAKRPADLGSGIMVIERLITEAYES